MSLVEHKVYRFAGQIEGADKEVWTKDERGGVIIFCQHGNAGRLTGSGEPGKDWTIKADGSVQPSVYWRGSCECHIYVRLEGWRP